MFVIVGASHTNICMLCVYDSRQMALLPPQKSIALTIQLPKSAELQLEYPLYTDSSNTLITSLISLSQKLEKGVVKLLGKIERRDLNMLTKMLRTCETIPEAVFHEFFAH
jgi:hypothetical protein